MIVSHSAYHVFRYCNTRDMGPTIAFDWIAMLRLDGLQTCTEANLVLIYQFANVLATIEVR